MDWTAHDVITRPLAWYERASDSRSLNGWHAFQTVALREYRALSQEQQLIIIRAVTSLRRLTPTLVKAFKLVKRCWKEMAVELKENWKLRANL